MRDALKDAASLHTTIVMAEHCIKTLECLGREAPDAATKRMANQMAERIKRNQGRLVAAYDNACFAVRNGREFS
ncbi:hypothetical protein [Burkholderia ambifaria]|uniref:hypothetical protein n=1 Tax=Burkholderia ambifaria TaxID=152480 RepID=UPI00158A02F5|nr:hypothetical protein [Burkholderia ambifaria]